MVKRATRQDVARAAGVSGATVSRVYNTPELVDAETAQRVRDAAISLGFVPDKHAAALRRGTSNTLLFVEIEGGPGYRWPSQRAYQSLYGEIVRAVLHATQGSRWSLQLVSLASPEEVAGLEGREFAGILGFDVTDQGLASALAALGRPVVCAHHGDHLTGVSTVTTDNRAGGRLQASFLVERGRKKVAYVTGLTSEVRSHRLRQEGFDEVLVPRRIEDALGFAEGREAGRALAPALRSGELDAVACVNDLTALGVVQGLLSEGLEVPGAVPVVGYDHLVLTDLVPGLPTVDARLPEVYTRALEVLGTLVLGGEEVHESLVPRLA